MVNDVNDTAQLYSCIPFTFHSHKLSRRMTLPASAGNPGTLEAEHLGLPLFGLEQSLLERFPDTSKSLLACLRNTTHHMLRRFMFSSMYTLSATSSQLFAY